MSYRMVEENLRVAMRSYARVNNLGEAREYPGLDVSFCGLSCSIFNSALLNAPAQEHDLERMVTLAGVHFAQRKVGWTFWLCEDLLSDRARRVARLVLCSSGLNSIAQAPGMYAERLEPPRRCCRNLRMQRVDSEAARMDFAHLSSIIFALPFQTALAIYGSETLWSDPMTGWIGYLDGQPVSLVCVVIGGGVSGVYSVGTLPAYQGRGCAETLIRHALSEASGITGNEASVLQSTARGLSLYSRMGYRTVTRFGVYINESWRKN